MSAHASESWRQPPPQLFVSSCRTAGVPMGWFLACVAVCIVTTACGSNSTGAAAATDVSADGSLSDSGVSDGSTGDAASSDIVSADVSAADVNPTNADATASDATASDSATADASASDVMDATTADVVAGKETPWGAITGACGAVTAELKVGTPSFFVTTLTFKDAAAFSSAGLSAGAKKRYEGENAGGSSICSEVMSIQVLHECEGAALYKTEKEISYTSTQGAITDYEATIGGEKVGVSVTRAYKGPVNNTYTDADATNLLKKKLAGVLESSAKVSAADKWTKQVLHIWTLRADWVPVLKKAWDTMDATTKADTIVLVSIEIPPSGGKGWIVPDNCGVK